ncbi:sulfatase, partial [Myxococcota bacterium]|nr:sulfatase [Myxococcota bacterium]
GERQALVEAPLFAEEWKTVGVDLSPWRGRPRTLRLSHRPSIAPNSTVDWGEPVLLVKERSGPPINVILVTLATTRADTALAPELTPHLAALAGQGVRFTNAWSAATSTSPSHASILTGLAVDQHGVLSNRNRLPDGVDTLAERLSERGLQTAASVTVDHLGPGAGFDQGFGRFRPAQSGDAQDGASSIDDALVWLKSWSKTSARPFFLWVHLFDPHTPYGPPTSFLETEWAQRGFDIPPRRSNPPTVPIFPGPLPTPLSWLEGTTDRDHIETLYRAGVAYADHLLGRIIEEVEALGLSSSTLIVVTADHGEALGEQGVFYQHAGLWPASLRVPLVWAGPGWPRGVEVASPISGVDIAPAILATVDGEPNRARLYQALSEANPAHRVWFAETDLRQLGFRDGDVHYIEALGPGQFGVRTEQTAEGPLVTGIQRYRPGRKWLFDIHADPDLNRNLAGHSGSGSERYRALIRERQKASVASSPKRSLTEREESELRALGYGD